MSAEELDTAAIRAREAAATSGPWRNNTQMDWPYEPGFEVYIAPADGGTFGSDGTVGYALYPHDAEFVSHARQDVPALLGEIDRLRKVIEDAPHDYECAAGTYPDEDCDCWKADLQ